MISNHQCGKTKVYELSISYPAKGIYGIREAVEEIERWLAGAGFTTVFASSEQLALEMDTCEKNTQEEIDKLPEEMQNACRINWIEKEIEE